ncbi:hypothetical protein BGW37DRAFT_19005 [Umbelopsis sp. PMI_123]|nr:hypothetical protein BGW37DRAFT_19005 [Umbelopsis sp. PMI_123]
MFSPDKWEILSEVNSVLCITLVCFFIGRKLSSQQGPAHYARILVIALFVVSWAFNLISTLLVSTNNNNIVSCTMSTYMCITLYAFSKILIYLFLIEKIFVVVSNEPSRFDSRLYRINLALLTPYIAIFVLLLLYHNAYIVEDGTYFCLFHLRMEASLPLVIYDFFITTYYTLVFIKMLIWPSQNMTNNSPSAQTSLRYVAKRNLVAAVVALLVSSANIVILIALDGVERGLVCLTSCTLDVTLNAGAIFWVSSHQSEIEHLNRQRMDRRVKLEIKQHQEVIIMREIATRL